MQNKTQRRNPDAGIAALTAFSTREGHAAVPRCHLEGEFPLGEWVRRQRHSFKSGRLSARRIEQLESFPSWEWERVTALKQRHQDFWDDGVAALTIFAAREGHSLVPSRFLEGSLDLGRWVRAKRDNYRKGQLSREQIKQLEAFPGWKWDRETKALLGRHQQLWNEGIAALEAFSAREGHCSVPRKHREGDVGLGYWVDSKRKNYRNGTLSVEQIAQLESFPAWDWGPYDDRWWPDYETFKQFVLEGGSANPDRGTVHNGLELSGWCRQQRDRYAIGNLSAAATEALEEVAGWSWRRSGPVLDRREQALAAYRKFVRREGHGHVPTSHDENKFPLGEYLYAARWRLGQGILSTVLRDCLDAVSTDWMSPLPAGTVVWTRQQQKAVARYQRFVQREGHGRVPRTHVEWGFNLGSYLANKRQAINHRRAASTTNQQALDAISTDWRLPLEARNQHSTTYPKAA